MLGTGDPTQYIQIQEMMAAKEPYEKLWQGAVKFHRYYDKWMNGPLLEVNAEEVEEEVSGMMMTSLPLHVLSILSFTSGLVPVFFWFITHVYAYRSSRFGRRRTS